MQSRNELYDIIHKGRPDIDDATINTWIKYLSQLKGCHLQSVASPEIDKEKWLKDRESGIGGSEIASIAGKSQWGSPREVWLKKTGQLVDEVFQQSEAARWGNLLETVVANEWAYRNNKKYVHIPVILCSDEFSFMFANVDGFVLSDDGEYITGILEIKTTTEYNREVWEEGPIPENYVCQTNWYMSITGLNKYTIVCLVGGQKLYSYDLLKDPDLCNELMSIADRFWNYNVRKMIEPEATEADLTRLSKQEFDDTLPPVVLTDDDSEKLVDTYIMVREKIKTLDDVKKGLYAQIFVLLGKNTECATQQHTVRLQVSNKRTCDIDALTRDHPEIAKQYIRNTVSQSLRIK